MKKDLFKSFPLMVEHHRKIGSTNDRAFEILLADGVKANGTIVLADYQEKGRGRFQREWFAREKESLLMSVVFYPPRDYPYHLIPLAVGLSVVQSIKKYTDKNVYLKWPNDIVFGGRKLGGILVESRSYGDEPLGFVIGIGINVKGKSDSFPDEIKKIAITLEEISGKACSVDEFLRIILREIRRILNISYFEKDFFMKELKKHFIHKKGDLIKINTTNLIVVGYFVEIGDNGELVISTEKGNLSLVQGEIVDASCT